jgi:hypothetical protein
VAFSSSEVPHLGKRVLVEQGALPNKHVKCYGTQCIGSHVVALNYFLPAVGPDLFIPQSVTSQYCDGVPMSPCNLSAYSFKPMNSFGAPSEDKYESVDEIILKSLVENVGESILDSLVENKEDIEITESLLNVVPVSNGVLVSETEILKKSVNKKPKSKKSKGTWNIKSSFDNPQDILALIPDKYKDVKGEEVPYDELRNLTLMVIQKMYGSINLQQLAWFTKLRGFIYNNLRNKKIQAGEKHEILREIARYSNRAYDYIFKRIETYDANMRVEEILKDMKHKY